MITNETIESAKSGQDKAIKEIMSSVEGTFYSLVESNRNGFAHQYEVEDFKQQFPSVVWDAIKKYDVTRGASFNTYFHNFTFWEISKNKKKIARGQFETPLSGFSECEELTEFILEKLIDPNVPNIENLIDANEMKQTQYNLNEQESFIFDGAINGLTNSEIREGFKERFGVSNQYFYQKRNQTVSKIKKKENLLDGFASVAYN